MKKIFIFSLIITIFAACQPKGSTGSTEDEKPIIIDCYLRTDKTNFVTGEVYIKHQSDSTLPNIESATLQGKTMTQSKVYNDKVWRMRIDQEINANDFEFIINHAGNAPIKLNLSPNPITSFKIKEGVMSKTKGFYLDWEGSKVNSTNETLVLLITDSKGQSMSLNRIGETAESGMFIDPVQLQYFAAGPATIYLVRKTLIQFPAEGYVNKKAELEYYTDELKINIEE